MYKLLDRIDKMIPLSTLLKRYLNKEIITNEETKDSNQIIFVVGTKGYNAKIYLYDKIFKFFLEGKVCFLSSFDADDEACICFRVQACFAVCLKE